MYVDICVDICIYIIYNIYIYIHIIYICNILLLFRLRDILPMLSKQRKHILLRFLVSKDIFIYLFMEGTRTCQILFHIWWGQWRGQIFVEIHKLEQNNVIQLGFSIGIYNNLRSLAELLLIRKWKTGSKWQRCL